MVRDHSEAYSQGLRVSLFGNDTFECFLEESSVHACGVEPSSPLH